MKVKIIHSKDLEISDLDLKTIKKFIKFCIKPLGIKSDTKIHLLKKNHDTKGISSGGFNPNDNTILSRFEGRALMDVLRTIAHELVHLSQKDNNELENSKDIPDIGGKIEDDANAKAGQLIKMFVKEHDAKWIYKY